MDRKQYLEVYLSSIDRGLDVFGSNVRLVVYYELEKTFGISREDIPLKPDLFVETIDKLFSVGALTVSRAICKELEASSGIKDLSTKNLLSALKMAYHVHMEKQPW